MLAMPGNCHPEAIRFTQSALREGQGSPKDLNVRIIAEFSKGKELRATDGNCALPT
jgi:hypothetical protein